MLRKLNFDLSMAMSIQFLDRYLRHYGIDQMGLGKNTQKFEALAYSYCAHMLEEATFLRFQSSLCAAASLIAALNIVQSPVARSIEVLHIPKE